MYLMLADGQIHAKVDKNLKEKNEVAVFPALISLTDFILNKYFLKRAMNFTVYL